MTPNQLAKELGISPKTLRNWLRTNFARPLALKHKRWRIPQPAVDKARERWQGRLF
jgi:predicted site-specific integrase-resolvase